MIYSICTKVALGSHMYLFDIDFQYTDVTTRVPTFEFTLILKENTTWTTPPTQSLSVKKINTEKIKLQFEFTPSAQGIYDIGLQTQTIQGNTSNFQLVDGLNNECFSESELLVLSQIRQSLESGQSPYTFPLISKTFDEQEIFAVHRFLLSGKQLTMGNEVFAFEQEFAQYMNVNYAVMVNSGSSANLLAIAAITNHFFEEQLSTGDEVIVPVVCWSTTVWPLLQCGLKPVFVDIDKTTMNINATQIEKHITARTKAIMLVHTMGNPCNMEMIVDIVQRHKLLLIEDTCESLGSTYKNKMVGTFGTFGTFSFYYSHHITTIEGGMVTCHTKQHYDLLRSLRAHGWTRLHDIKDQEKWIKKYPDVDHRYMFINVGYNLRPMELQAVIGRIQLKKLEEKNQNRIYNFTTIRDCILEQKCQYFIFPKAESFSYTAWFGLCLYLDQSLEHYFKDFILYLEQNGVENRPIITGNFCRQPYFIEHPEFDFQPKDFPVADDLHFHGLYIGLSCEKMSNDAIERLTSILIQFFNSK